MEAIDEFLPAIRAVRVAENVAILDCIFQSNLILVVACWGLLRGIAQAVTSTLLAFRSANREDLLNQRLVDCEALVPSDNEVGQPRDHRNKAAHRDKKIRQSRPFIRRLLHHIRLPEHVAQKSDFGI